MNKFIQLAHPLLEFCEQIGLNRNFVASQEELEHLKYYDEEFEYKKFEKITLPQLKYLVETYSNAFTGRFSFAGDSLEINSSLDDEKFNNFKTIVENSPTLLLRFQLDKKILIEKLKNDLLTSPELNIFPSKIFLYLFVESLKNKLCGLSLEDLESTFWETEEACKIILLVPEHEIYLNGAYLSILGGNKLHKLNDALTNGIPNHEKIKSMYGRCQDLLRWKGIDIQYLTPLHFRVQGEATQDDPIARAIYLYQTKMIVLYTADQTVLDEEQYVAIYSAEKQRKKIIIFNELSDITNEEIFTGANRLLKQLERIYSSSTIEDALVLFQLVIVRALQITEPSDCHRLLLLKADYIVNEIRWLWKTFAEGKIDNYIDQVKALEDYVAIVIQSFSDQVSSMVKSLSDTMLAAVGVALASFIAALFKDEFNPTIFRIGIITYGVYVLIFPLIFNMSYQKRYFNTLWKNVKHRLDRFNLILDPSKVQEIVNHQDTEIKKRFNGWFRLIISTYVFVFILALLAAIFVPSIVPQTQSGQQSTPSTPSSPGSITPSVSPPPITPVTPTSP